MNKKIIFFVLLTIFNNLPVWSYANVYIVTKVNNEIITNSDVTKEARYLNNLETDKQL